MKKTTWLEWLTSLPALMLAASCLLLTSAQGQPAAPQAKTDAAAAYKKLTALAGNWTEATETKKEMAANVSYRLTAAGHTVMETMFPGTDHEMVSMYHLDGASLIMTHYCAMGNQPRLKLNLEKSTSESLVFEFVSGTNMDPAKDPHIHGLKLTFKAPDTVEAEWSSHKDGKPGEGLRYQITRKK